MDVWLLSIKCFRGSCGLRKVWYDTNECLAATLDGQLFVTRVTRRVLLMEQKLLSHWKHPRCLPVLVGSVLLDLYFSVCCFVDRWLSFCPFSVCRCIICSSLIYGFGLYLYYLQVFLMCCPWWLVLSFTLVVISF